MHLKARVVYHNSLTKRYVSIMFIPPPKEAGNKAAPHPSGNICTTCTSFKPTHLR